MLEHLLFAECTPTFDHSAVHRFLKHEYDLSKIGPNLIGLPKLRLRKCMVWVRRCKVAWRFKEDPVLVFKPMFCHGVVGSVSIEQYFHAPRAYRRKRIQHLAHRRWVPRFKPSGRHWSFYQVTTLGNRFRLQRHEEALVAVGHIRGLCRPIVVNLSQAHTPHIRTSLLWMLPGSQAACTQHTSKAAILTYFLRLPGPTAAGVTIFP